MTERKIKIGMVLDQRFPPDARVEREAVALVEAGYEVHLLCEIQEGQEPEELYRGIFVHRVNPEEVTFLLPFINVRTRFPYRGLFKAINRFLWNIDTVWHTLIHRFVYRYDIDVLHIHDLRLASTGLAIAEKYELPLVADLHENYPALMEMLKGRENAEKGRRAREKWERIEKFCTFEADRVITVIEESRDRLVLNGVRPQKVIVLPNTVDVEKFETAEVDTETVRKYKPHFVMTYVGHINNRHRGIHTVIEAMAELKDEIPELRFIAAGGYREDYLESLKKLIEHYGLEDRIEFTGWLDETDFVTYIEASDICLCPHLSTEHTDTTFPNKVYLYNLFARPVVVSDCVPLKRYIGESGGGLVFDSGNAHDLAEKIRILYDDPNLRKTLGRQGQDAVKSRFNWKATSNRLIALYNDLTEVPHQFRVPVGI